jgi:hypothetical protein
MAKAAQKSGGEPESIMGYFRPILEANPRFIKNRKNDELYELWLKDHPDYKEVPERVRNGLSNLKSTLRAKLKKRKGKRVGQAPAAEANGGAAPMKRTARPAGGQLERLEEQIDECLARAKDLDREGLEDVIHLLRRARNRVVVAQMIG